MGVILRWGSTGLMLGDALTKDEADAADLLRAWVRARLHELSTLQRAREEREARSLTKTHGEVRGHGRRTAGENVSGRTHRRGTDRVVDNSSMEAHASELPCQGRVVRSSVGIREGKGDAALRGEHGQHPDHDSGISGG